MSNAKYCKPFSAGKGRRHAAKAALLAALISQTAHGDAVGSKHHFDIPAQSLNQALLMFGRQSQQQLMYGTDVADNLRSRNLQGDYTADEAIRILLGDAPLQAVTTGEGTITLQPRAAELHNNLGPQTMPAVQVVDKAVYDLADPYNPYYVLPSATSGTKTDTPVMETPLNVQVISKQVLKDQQVINLSDALKNVSGVTTYANSGTNTTGDNTQQIFLRGFSSSTYFRNGFRLTEGASLRNMSNVESVEVAKGPAAILYGLVEPGGMLNVITKQPLATPYYALNQQFGSFANYRTTIDTSGPLTKDDTLLYRVNASYQNSGSFQEFVKKEDFFIAPVLKWNISPQTQATVEFEYNHQNLVENYGFRPIINGQVVDLSRRLNYGEATPTAVDTFYGGFNWSHAFNDDWEIKHHLSINQTARNGYQDSPQFVADTTITRLPAFRGNQSDTYAIGIDLTGHFKTFDLEHTLLFGGDYYRTQSLFVGSFIPDANSLFLGIHTDTIDAFNPVHTGFSTAAGFEKASNISTTADQYGVYIQDQIKLPYDLHVLGGIRYQNFHQSRTQQFSGVFEGFPGTDSAQSQDAVTPRVGILWQAQPWLSLYANFVESFGPNSGRIYKSLTESTSVPATSANQYEGGIKTEFYDGRLRANLAYFDLTKTNIATADPDPQLAALGGVVVTGAAQSRGYEFDVTGEILPGWNAIATYSNTDVKVIKSNDVSGGGNGGALPEGSRFYGVPRNTASLWNTYEFQHGDIKGFKFGGGVTLRDGQLACCDSPAYKIPGYVTLDLIAAYIRQLGKSKVTVQLNINNLLDKHYYTGLNTTSANNAAFLDFGTPRSVMGSIGVQF
jgi:iron complex outermembrane receptor protein